MKERLGDVLSNIMHETESTPSPEIDFGEGSGPITKCPFQRAWEKLWLERGNDFLVKEEN